MQRSLDTSADTYICISTQISKTYKFLDRRPDGTRPAAELCAVPSFSGKVRVRVFRALGGFKLRVSDLLGVQVRGLGFRVESVGSRPQDLYDSGCLGHCAGGGRYLDLSTEGLRLSWTLKFDPWGLLCPVTPTPIRLAKP